MRFYTIEKKPKGDRLLERYRTDFEYDESVAKGNAPKCPNCGAFVGMLEALPPYRVHLETWGEDFGELAFGMSDFLAVRRFCEEYTRSGLKGLHVFAPVEVRSHKGHGEARGKPPEYFRALPRIGGARIDLTASGVEWGDNTRPSCKVCLSGAGVLKRWRRIVVDESSWNGDDIFYAYGIPGVLLVSARFFEWANLQRFHNLVMKSSTDESHDFYPWEAS